MIDTTLLRQLLGEATPGKWAVRVDGQEGDPEGWGYSIEAPGHAVVAFTGASPSQENENFALIVAAINILPELIAENERLWQGLAGEHERQNEDLRAALQKAHSKMGDAIQAIRCHVPENARSYLSSGRDQISRALASPNTDTETS